MIASDQDVVAPNILTSHSVVNEQNGELRPARHYYLAYLESIWAGKHAVADERKYRPARSQTSLT